MNELLKSININLKLTPYRALACGREDGYLEYVHDSKTIQDILKNYQNSLTVYFLELAKKGVEKEGWFIRKHMTPEEK
jgi:phosphatidylinositol 3-kinase